MEVEFGMGTCGYIKVEKHEDERGCLWVSPVPFEVKSSYTVTGLDGKPRGGHAHREATQVLWVSRGSLTAIVQGKGAGTKSPTCETLQMIPSYAILIPPQCWVTLGNFSDDCVYQVWSDREYDPQEYVREPKEFARLTGSLPNPVAFADGMPYVGDPSWTV